MKSVCCWLLVLLSLVAATQAIKCLCDKPFCLDDAAEKEEECHAHYDKDYFEKYPSKLKEMKEKMPTALLAFDTLRRQVKGEPERTPVEIRRKLIALGKEADKLMNKLSNAEKARLTESLYEIGSITQATSAAGKRDDKAWLEMFDRALAGTYEPEHVEYNFCIKKIDGSGITSRSCGLTVEDKLGSDMKVGCHKNPAFVAIANDYPRYCRCDTDLCNSGDVEMTDDHLSSPPPCSSEGASEKNLASLLAGSLMRVCFSVVLSQICRA